MRKWLKPKLVILTKGTAHERVLEICKNGDGGPSDPAQEWVDCEFGPAPCLSCVGEINS